MTEPIGSTAFSSTSAGTAKADLGKRFIAVIIDAVIGAVVGLIPVVGGIVAAAYWLCRDGLEYDFMDRRSIGKKVMKLRPVRDDGQPMDLQTSFRRNWMFALGGLVALLAVIPIIGWILLPIVALVAVVIGIVEAVLVVTHDEGRRFGDKMAGTHVIETVD